MSGLNKVQLLGNVGKDPEVTNFESGSKKVAFSLATNERYKNKAGEIVDETEWHNVVVWRDGLSAVAEKYVKKGNQIYVEGKIKTRKYEGRDGTTKYITEIFASSIILLGQRNDTTSVHQSQEADAGVPGGGAQLDRGRPLETDEDDLPF